MRRLLRALKAKRVQYVFGRITPNTDKMIAAFNREAAAEGSDGDDYISSFDLRDPASLRGRLVGSITRTISATVTAASRLAKLTLRPVDGGSRRVRAASSTLHIPLPLHSLY